MVAESADGVAGGSALSRFGVRTNRYIITVRFSCLTGIVVPRLGAMLTPPRILKQHQCRRVAGRKGLECVPGDVTAIRERSFDPGTERLAAEASARDCRPGPPNHAKTLHEESREAFRAAVSVPDVPLSNERRNRSSVS